MVDHVKYLSEKFIELIPGINYNPKKENLYFNSRPVPNGSAFWELCKKSLGENGLFLLRREHEDAYADISNNGMTCDKVREAILQAKKELYKPAESDVIDLSTVVFNNSIPTPLSDLLIIENPEESDQKYLYDKTQNKVYNYAVIPKTLERLLGKENVAQYLNQNTRQCRIVYEPFKDRMYKENDHWTFNEYTDPKWRANWVRDETITQPPEDIHAFLSHLSPDPHKYLYPILRTILDGRLTFAVVLRGAPGCGKNIYVEHIAANLVGCDYPANNYTKATRGFQTSTFHDYLAKVRVALWDEAILKNALRYCIKDYLNTKSNFEAKHKKTKSPTNSHFSMFIANNYKTDVQLDFDDRKFLVVPLSDVDLLDAKSQEWVDTFVQETCTDPEVLGNLASYLMNCIKPIKRCVKTTEFYEICWISLPQYFKFFIKACVQNKQFTQKDYFKFFPTKDARPSKEKLQDLFKVYCGGNKLTEGLGEFFEDVAGHWRFESKIFGRQDLLIFDDAYQNTLKKKDTEEVSTTDFKA
jgi:hypothetical protein